MINLNSVLEVVTATHPGMVRSHNEDSLAAEAGIGLAVLADGMGGYNAGEVASGIAVELIRTEMKKALAGKSPEELNGKDAERLIMTYATRANSAIYQASHGHDAGRCAVARQPDLGRAHRRLAPLPAARRRAGADHARPFFVAGTDR
jgi:serine/threonine protein phosphatase PrpC